jgi:hypothetical protein
MALIDLLEYATRVREYGAVIKSAAVVLELADHAGAASIHRVDNTNAPPITSSSGPLQMPVLPPVPHQPPIASIPELPALPAIGAEQFSADLHSGPGAADLRDFSRAWHNYSQDITHTADDTRSVGVKVNEHWSGGDNAANNIMDHAKWLDSAAAWAERLSVGAEAVAHAFDIAKIEKKFDKHAADFGITAPRGTAGFDEFEQAVRSQVHDPATLHIDGIYRGSPVIINYNPNTGLAVIQKPSGEFVSGWRLSPEQVANVLQRGPLR